jgi:hypothetical protein
MLNNGLTVEASFSASGNGTGMLFGVEAADGQRAARVGFRDGRLVLLEGDRGLASHDIASGNQLKLRLTLDARHVAKVYVDAGAEPVMTARLKRPVTGETIRWGHFKLDGKTSAGAASHWDALHYSLEGAFAPDQRQF